MKLLCDSKYIILPVSHRAQSKCLKFLENDQLVYDLQIELDFINPDVEFYLNMERFIGKELEILCEPEIHLDIKQSNTRYPSHENYIGKYRPEFHFTPQRGWMNDPNGLVFYKGLYHMFYQYNPVGSKWGNMHWGHAVSTDFVHWEEKEIALYPDELGTMFSGSAIVDTNNVSGLKQNENDVILLFYTAAGGGSELSKAQPFTQCLAYSIDGGNTFVKYSNNPIVPLIEQGNRDPKIIYDSASHTYVMALYLIESRFMLLTSTNLLDWKPQQEITLQDDSECPDFYPLPVDGDAKNIKWIFSAASDRYMLGHFDGGRFYPETASKRLHYGKDSYAAQTWSNIDSDAGQDASPHYLSCNRGRRIRIAWNRYEIPSLPFNTAMNFPCEMTLKTFMGEAFLCAWPVREIENIYGESLKDENISLPSGEQYVRVLTKKLYDIKISMSCSCKGNFRLSVFGLDIHGDLDTNELRCLDNTAPLESFDNGTELRLLIDVSNLELFINSGKALLSIGHIQDYNLNRLVLQSINADILIKEINIVELKNIWDQAE